MNKKEVLEHFGVSKLADISDNDLIKLAKDGKFGRITECSAHSLWIFESNHDFAEHVRKALEKGKQLQACFYDGEGLLPNEIDINYV